MLIKPITYTDLFTGKQKTEDFYFNLTKAEALEINILDDLDKISESNSPAQVLPVFKHIIHYAYGVRLPNGKFTKDADQTADFLASDAYSELFLELIQGGEDVMAQFISAIVNVSPEELKKFEVEKAMKEAAESDVKPSSREIFQAARAEAERQEAENNVPVAEVNTTSRRAYHSSIPDAPNDPRDEDREWQEFQQFKAQRAAQESQESVEQAIARPPHEQLGDA